MENEHISSHGTGTTYIIGFLASLLFTVVPYLIVVNHWGNSGEIMVLILGFAVLQLAVQMIFFLHLNARSSSRWNMVAFLFTILTVVIVVGGSLWIMKNLN